MASNFIVRVVQAVRNQPITRYGDGTQARSCCDVGDLIAGFVRLMASPDELAGPVNLGNPGEFTRMELADAVRDKLLDHARAVRGLIDLEPSMEKRFKYLDFVDLYADLDDNEGRLYTQLYPHELATWSGFAQRFLEKGREEGREVATSAAWWRCPLVTPGPSGGGLSQ